MKVYIERRIHVFGKKKEKRNKFLPLSPISHHLHLWILHEKKKGDIKILEITEQIPLASEEEDKKKAWTVENCGVWNLSARWSWNLRVAYSRRCRRLLAATPAGGVIWIRAAAHQKPIEIRDRVLWETITTKKKKICCSLSKYIYIFFFPFFFHDISGVFYETAGSGVGLHRPPTADARCLSLLITRNSRRRQPPKMLEHQRRGRGKEK